MTARDALLSLRRVWKTTPWLHWLAVFAIPMLFCLVDKLVALDAILDMFAAKNERDFGRKLAGMALGVVEDFLVTTLLVAALVVLELVALGVVTLVRRERVTTALKIVGRSLRFLVVLACIVLTLAFVAADLLLIRSREMRFTTELIETYLREKDQASSLEVDPREVRLATQTVAGTAFVSLFFAVFYVTCVDLLWVRPKNTPAGYEFKPVDTKTPAADSSTVTFESLEEGKKTPASQSESASQSELASGTDAEESNAPNPVEVEKTPTASVAKWFQNKTLRLVVALVVGYIVLVIVTHAIAKSASTVVASIALNASLNELFRNWFHMQFQQGSGSGGLTSAPYYIQSDTESYELFEKDVLYRKTTGFKGPLAFDVEVDEKNPPNVLVLAVESFRYMDSLYMAENTTAGELMQKNNLSVTPQFDRWAKRGIAFNNMWSSWQTSRSLEAILFGQIAYDSVTNSGTTYGRKDTKLVGMPHMFKQKGYETVFTTGCITTYDQWDIFLPNHGFETVIAAPEMKKIAEESYNISKDDWDGPAKRGFNWGVHDDLSFEILGDMMIKKVKEQAERVKRGEKKQPFFLNHYTISSHHTFDAHPTWLDSEKLPDFTPLCEGWESECTLIKKYTKLRYFTDMELGKFLDKMETAGVLNDTIVVIVGDHGQSPEMGLANPILYQTAVTHVASTMIAEGRLGKYAGMIYNDATHHYDLLNTLADIVGAPQEGFLQTGVGRSLKRQIPFGERLVYSNNPMKKMSIVRAHKRLVYDHSTSAIGLFDTIQDPLEKNDLFPTLSDDESMKMREFRRYGREVNSYFKRRWDKKCLTKVEC